MSETPGTTYGGDVQEVDARAGTPPLFADRCKRHGDIAEPPKCGACADVRKANRARPLTLVASPMSRCIVHAESYVTACRGCEADRKGVSA